MQKPIIGVVPQFSQDGNQIISSPAYTKAVKDAGGIPVILPLYNEIEDVGRLLSMLDGVLFTGGPDINPLHYGEETHPNCGRIITERDRLELSLLPEIMKYKLPVLGICRGIQSMAVAMGGGLLQDIKSQSPSDVGHYQNAANEVMTHHINVSKDSLLYSIISEARITVNSFHHQAVKKTGKGQMVSAIADDGIIEALELRDYPFFLGVQWHPEMLYLLDEYSFRIFHGFVLAAEKRKDNGTHGNS